MNEIRKESIAGKLTVNRVMKTEYQKKGTLTAELKQTITVNSYYPTKSVSSNLQDNIFSVSDFGGVLDPKPYENKETRVAWIDVPEGTSVEDIQNKLSALPKANLYRILSNHPIVTDSQQYGIDNPDLDITLDDYADKQAVRYPDSNEKAGQLATDKNGKVQYRKVFFSKLGKEDQDLRTDDPSDFYASPEINEELNDIPASVIESQMI